MKTGVLEVRFNLDFIEYTGKEEDKEKFFDVFSEKTNLFLEDDAEKFSFDEKNNFTITFGEWKQKKIIVKVGDIVVFCPANDFYNSDKNFPFCVYSKKDFKEVSNKNNRLVWE